MDISPQSISRVAFLLFVLLQTPCFVLPGPHGKAVPMSPLQLSVSWSMTNYEGSIEYLRPLLVPGTWMREAVVPYVQCVIVLGRPQCKKALSQLIDFQRLAPFMEPTVGLDVFEQHIKQYHNAILVGSGVVTIAGLLSAYVPVRLSLLGFAMMLFGIIQEQRTPLPPFFFMAVLVALSVFASDHQRRATKRLRRTNPPAAADAAASSSTENKKEQ
jgi:hypothetical protein